MEGILNRVVIGNTFELLIDTELFDKEIIFKSAYSFLDKCYFYFRQNENNVIVQAIAKENNIVDLEQIILDYYDELINFSLRINVELTNKEIRDHIISTAIANKGHNQESSESKQIDFDKDIEEILKEIENDPDLKIDEEEIERILKEIEEETQKQD